METEPKDATEIFICYAREDEEYRKSLEKQLRVLQRQNLINVWHDREITPGMEWQREIDSHLNAANVILLLVSPDFMDSDYCYGNEMDKAMERHERGEAHVIPIIIRHVYWEKAPFSKLQALPTDGVPVTDPYWHTKDLAFFKVAEGIRKVIETIQEERLRKVQEERLKAHEKRHSLLEQSKPKPLRLDTTEYQVTFESLCPYCGATVLETALFCPICGRFFKQPSESVSSRFTPISSTSVQTQTQSPQQPVALTWTYNESAQGARSFTIPPQEQKEYQTNEIIRGLVTIIFFFSIVAFVVFIVMTVFGYSLPSFIWLADLSLIPICSLIPDTIDK